MVSFTIHGIGVSGGIAIGRAQLVSHATLEVAHYAIPAAKVRAEVARFEAAVNEVQKELETLHGSMSGEDVPGEFGAFLDVHWMILNDATLAEAPKKIIAEQRCNAEWALTQQMAVLVEQFDEIEDPYLRERRSDVVQVVERVLKRLMGRPGALPAASSEEQTILVAHDLSPADVIQFKSHRYGAFLTDLGGPTSHTAIVARGLNVPAVVATHNARGMIRDGEILIVDGDANVVIVNPDRAVLAEYRLKQTAARARAPEAEAPAPEAGGHARRLPRRAPRQHRASRGPRAGDGGRRERRGAVPLRVPVPQPARTPLRRRAVRGLPERRRRPRGQAVGDPDVRPGGRQDQGGLGGLVRVAPNPALGLRAVRFCLAEPRLFLTQLRAILRASHYGNVRILIPMLASAGEIDQALAMIAQAKESLREQGIPFDPNVPVGGMIEIPAAVLAIGAFLTRLDFLSIGTNDLIQYTLAVDRADEAVSHLYDPLHPAVLKLIGTAIQSAAKARVPIAVCGEMAGDLRLTRLLLGMGLTEFSMHPAHILAVKQRVLTTDVATIRPIVDRMRRTDDPVKVVALLDRLND